MTPRWACLLAALGVAVGKPQSNYNLQDLNIEFEEGAGLPEFGTLDGTVTELGKFQKYFVVAVLSLLNVGATTIWMQ